MNFLISRGARDPYHLRDYSGDVNLAKFKRVFDPIADAAEAGQ
jgi:hypothetical protein